MDGIEYGSNGSIEFLQTAEGRALPGASSGKYAYEYALKDNLGNPPEGGQVVRSVVKETGEVLEVSDYYAFGLRMVHTSNKDASPPNRYRYQPVG